MVFVRRWLCLRGFEHRVVEGNGGRSKMGGGGRRYPCGFYMLNLPLIRVYSFPAFEWAA